MDARSTVLAAAVAVAVVGPPSAWAAGRGGHGPVFLPGGAFHGGGFHAGGGFRGASRGFAGARGLPPVSGVIHERVGAAPTFTAYGHLGTVFRPGVYGRRRFADRGGFRGGLRFGAGRLVYGGGFGGYGGRYGGDGEAGGYGGAGVYGGQGSYGAQGADGSHGTQSGSGEAGAGQGFGYASEVPLASRFAEPPLAPSPYGVEEGANGYAYAASEDIGPGPRIVTVRRRSPGCGCAPQARAAPTIYRYGVGTAY